MFFKHKKYAKEVHPIRPIKPFFFEPVKVSWSTETTRVESILVGVNINEAYEKWIQCSDGWIRKAHLWIWLHPWTLCHRLSQVLIVLLRSQQKVSNGRSCLTRRCPKWTIQVVSETNWNVIWGCEIEKS